MTGRPSGAVEDGRDVRYTVLGANGFVGSRLVKMLRGASANCCAPVRGDSEVLNRDLGRVFYCIGLTADYADRPFDTVEAHVTFLARLFAQSRFERLLYLSSTRLYDGLEAEVCGEDKDLLFNPSNPRHIYDLSKALGESLCLTASDGRACVARLANVYDDAPGSTGFLSELLLQLSVEREFTLASPSGLVRDYVAMNDVTRALKTILDSGQQGIFNVASGENVSNQEIVDTLNESGFHITLSQYSQRQSAPLCDIGRLKALGLAPVLVREYLKSFSTGGIRGNH